MGRTVIFHGGVNDIDHTGSEELMGNYRNLMQVMSKSGCRGVVTGILPKFGAGMAWSSKAIGINNRVKSLCESYGITFIDCWDKFWGQKDLFAFDRIHLSRKGVKLLSDLYENEIRKQDF